MKVLYKAINDDNNELIIEHQNLIPFLKKDNKYFEEQEIFTY